MFYHQQESINVIQQSTRHSSRLRKNMRFLVGVCAIVALLALAAPPPSKSQKLSSGSPNFQQQGANSKAPLVPQVSCISGTIITADPNYVHPNGGGSAGNDTSCTGPDTAGRYDHYLLTLGGCATSPVTITTCGPAGCLLVPTGTAATCAAGTGGINDTTIAVYRKGGATAGTASGSGFNPADPCGTSTAPKRLVGYNDDTAGCGSGTLSSVTMTLGPGDFDVVVSGFSFNNNCEGRGLYNLSIVASSPGCTVTQQPTAADGTVSGRIVDGNGGPVAGTVISLSGTQTRKTITDENGNYHFANVETNGFYTVTPSRANYSFSPANRSFSLVGNTTEAGFTGVSSGDAANPVDTAEYFVRQQYGDFLDREPDEAGFNFWSDQILACGGDTNCVAERRRDVAAAFFISNEFQNSGYFVYRLYKGAFGERPTFAQYLPDRNRVIGGANLDASRSALADDFTQRGAFQQAYPASLTNEQFVNQLYDTAGLVPYTVQRQSEIDKLNHSGTRSQVLQDLVDDAQFKTAEYNRAFVLTEYFNYLRRGPDEGGYDFWLNVLNTGDVNNYRGMVCSFLTSMEYQRRFSAIVSHSNAECGGQ